MRDGVEALRGRERRPVDDRGPAHPVDPERAQVVTQVVVRGQVPPGGVDDEPVRAQLASGPLAGEGAVGRSDAFPAPDRLGEEQDRVSGDGRARAGGRGEPERRLERLDAAPERVGKDAVDLRERALDRPGVAVEPLPTGRDQPEDDDHGFVVREHERRQAVARPHAVAAPDAALPFDRNAEILERRDVAPHGAGVDGEPLGDLPARRERPGLKDVEELEEPGCRGLHAS